jgi:hypothetical protein
MPSQYRCLLIKKEVQCSDKFCGDPKSDIKCLYMVACQSPYRKDRDELTYICDLFGALSETPRGCERHKDCIQAEITESQS